MLDKRVRELEAENVDLRRLHESRCERVAAASEVLSRLASRECPACGHVTDPREWLRKEGA